MNKVAQRSPYWDNIKGTLVLLVVFSHILYQLQLRYDVINYTVDYIYMFHMPAFVFVSGYFGKSEHSQSAQAIIRLIFLYYIFNSIAGFIYGFSSLLKPMYVYWYLIALVVWRLTARYIAGFRSINLILLIAAVFIGFYGTIDNTLAASRIIAFYPYYMLGYNLMPEKSDELINIRYRRRLMTGLGFMVAACALAYFAYRFFEYSDNALIMGSFNNDMDVFGRIVLFVIAFTAIYSLRNICPDKKIPLISMFGRNSLWIFILHRPVTLWLSDRIIIQTAGVMMLISGLGAFAICIVFGNNLISNLMNRFADDGEEIFNGKGARKFTAAKLAALLVSIWFILYAIIGVYSGVTTDDIKHLINGTLSAEETEETESESVAYPATSAQQKNAIDGAFGITLVE